MSRSLMIISPTDVSYEDSFRYLLNDEEYHDDIVNQYINSLKLNCSKMEELASLGYVLIYSIYGAYEVFLGEKINYSQYQILKEFIENVLSGTKKVEFEIGIIDTKQNIKVLEGFLTDEEEIIKKIDNNININGKDDLDARKKI